MLGVTYIHKAHVDGLHENNVFTLGTSNDIERFLRSKKGFIEYVGICKDYNNDMARYLLKGVEPDYKDPPEPQPVPPATTVTSAQLKRYEIKCQLMDKLSHAWKEMKGRGFRTLKQLCAIPILSILWKPIPNGIP